MHDADGALARIMRKHSMAARYAQQAMLLAQGRYAETAVVGRAETCYIDWHARHGASQNRGE
jgi:hypothetical protein